MLDVSGQLLSPLEVDAALVAELKTATYTCTVPLVCGAILAGADQATRDRLEVYGRALGIAFQLVDDLLGVFGDPRVTGKSAVSDLREGKRTLLLAYAYGRAERADVALLDQYVGRADLTDAGADVVREIMRRTAAPRPSARASPGTSAKPARPPRVSRAVGPIPRRPGRLLRRQGRLRCLSAETPRRSTGRPTCRSCCTTAPPPARAGRS
ncbi:polyprenyl synthetase family protein [Oerskovia sp. M15]